MPKFESGSDSGGQAFEELLKERRILFEIRRKLEQDWPKF